MATRKSTRGAPAAPVPPIHAERAAIHAAADDAAFDRFMWRTLGPVPAVDPAPPIAQIFALADQITAKLRDGQDGPGSLWAGLSRALQARDKASHFAAKFLIDEAGRALLEKWNGDRS